jgi:hypothetical protein
MILLAPESGAEVCRDGEAAVVGDRSALGLEVTEADVHAFAASAIAIAMGATTRPRTAAQSDEVTSRPPDVLDRLAPIGPGSNMSARLKIVPLGKCGRFLGSLVGVWHQRRGS